MKVKIISPARLHLGLIDCGNATNRLFGGLGVTVGGLNTEIIFFSSNDWEFVDKTGKISSKTRKLILKLLKKLQKKGVDSCRIEIVKTLDEHIGLGSKTNILLNIIKGVFEINLMSYSQKDLINFSGRGGTSGIGINTFLHGGVIADSGHNELKGKRIFEPSSRRKILKDIPKIISRVEMPDSWKMLLFISKNKNNLISGEKESKIFRNKMPLRDIEVFKTLSAVYHGVIPALKDLDYDLLFRSIYDLNNCGMKKIEVSIQTTNTKKFMKSCWGKGIVCGLSSFGPTVYSIISSSNNYEKELNDLASKFKLVNMGKFYFSNKGAISKKIK